MAKSSGNVKSLKQETGKTTPIVIESAMLGGIGDSPYVGIKNSLSSLVGFDVHSVPGLMLIAQKLSKEGNGAPTDDYYKIVPCSDGNIYLFGKVTGNVYKNASGTYSLLGTVAPAAGAIGILDAIEWNGKIYYAMQNRLGQWDFTMAFSTRNDSFQTFVIGNTSFHPLKILNEVLYCGDGQNVAQYDGSSWVNNALVLKTPQIISSLGVLVTDLLVGITINNNVPYCYVYDWNTWSISYTSAYFVPEAGVNAFIQQGDSDVTIQAGLNGNMYVLNGATFSLIKQIPSNFPTLYSPTQTCTVNYPAVAVLNGIPLFGLSSLTNDPCYEGVYAYGSRSASYPKILSLPFPVSTGNLSAITIWSLAVVGVNLYVSSYDAVKNSYQIDKLDYSNKYNGAFFETRIIKYSRIWLDNFRKFTVNYQILPSGTNINLFYDANWLGYIQYGSTAASDIITDTDRNTVTGNLQPRAKTIRFKVATTAIGNTAPAIEDAIILVE